MYPAGDAAEGLRQFLAVHLILAVTGHGVVVDAHDKQELQFNIDESRYIW